MKDAHSLKVLLVDDDANILKTLQVSLSRLYCEVEAVNSVEKAVLALEQERFDLLLTDLRLEEKNGLDLVRVAKKQYPDLLSVVITAYASIENAIEVTKEGAFDYLPKPFTTGQLEHLLTKVRLVISLRRENLKLRLERAPSKDFFSGFTSVASARLKEFVNKVAPTEATILLVGESGTGKTELARLIHQNSLRSHRPFVIVNCTSLAETLFESEIFGHVKGSFTGAIQDHIGKFELASGGTLFLDEIGELSLSAQSKLLRFLQEKVIERVGSNKSLTLDTRVIAATNKQLETAVKENRFREDLYYRLNIFECHLVPLRFRKEDIPVFIQSFFTALVSSENEARNIPEPIMARLLSYPWPGNIRELKNVVERILLLSKGREVLWSDLPDSITREGPSSSPTSAFESLEELERQHIAKVLQSEKNQERAAQILGITTVTLWRKRKEYGLG